jgi:asparagine synthase (glutamine-hydrolysing)
MCGILGVWSARVAPIPHERLKAASDRIAHRGPDGHGYLGWTPGCAPVLSGTIERVSGHRLVFAHRRLSILDLSDGGRQPMVSADGRYVVIYNGELYNYIELRDELAARGARFRSRSDTEVLLAAFAEWGLDALPRFLGMFAFAMLDTQGRRLVLARDFFGIKPLYYTTAGSGRFAFASEAKALVELPDVPRVANAERVFDYLRLGRTDDDGRTMFADVYQLPPAHMLELDLDATDSTPGVPRRYWAPDLDARSSLTEREAAARLRDAFLESVRLHLRSDVPVGAALSGGIDSSAIVTAIRHLAPSAEIHTFSYVASPPAVSEEKWSTLVSDAAGTVRHTVRLTAEELVSDLDDLILTQDEPFGSTRIYAQYRVFRLAREAGIKVMLDGQGADELLAGYPPFLGGRLASLLRRGNVAGALRLTRALGYRGETSLRSIAFEAGGRLLPQALRPLARRFAGEGSAPRWLADEWFATRAVRGVIRGPYTGRGFLREQLVESLTVGLPSLLRYEDRNSMAHSIESRVPFLTPQLANFLLALPEDHLIGADGTTKSVFRRAMRGIVPDAVLGRRDKIAFETPEHAWLETLAPWVDRLFESDVARAVPALNVDAARQEWDGIRRGERRYDWRVWRWINLIRWTELYDVRFV